MPPQGQDDGYDIVARKGLHFLSFLIPVFIYLTPPAVYQPVTLLLFLIAVGVETLRNTTDWGHALFQRLFGSMLKGAERQRLRITGATYLLFSTFLLAHLFIKPIVVVSLLFLSVGDAVAGVVGRRWGRHKLIGNKTLEGSLAMLLSCWLIVWFVKEIPIAVKIIAGLGATVLEALEIPVDDNLLIPLGTGLFLWIWMH